MKFIIAIFFLSSLVFTANANLTKCHQEILHGIIADKKSGIPTKTLNKFWKTETPFTVVGSDGKKLPITFAFDSEIPHSDIYKLISKDDKLLEQLEQALKEALEETTTNSDFGAKLISGKKTKKTTFTIEELSKIFGKSPKQLLTFSIKKTARNKTTFNLTDLYPQDFNIMLTHYLKEVIDINDRRKLMASLDSIIPMKKTKAKEFLQQYKKIFDEAFKKNHNYEVDAHFDGQWIELIHNSSETSPAKFKEIIDYIHKKFPNAQAHFHIGIPTTVPNNEAIEVGRIIESRRILSMATSSDEGELYSTSFTLLKHHTENAEKSAGVIRFNLKRWKTPVNAHDLEVREGLLKERFNDLALASNLAANYKKLTIVTNLPRYIVIDKNTGNISGALMYIGTIMKNKNIKELNIIGEKLIDFSDSIRRHGIITKEIREKIADFLNKNDVMEYLDDINLYLN